MGRRAEEGLVALEAVLAEVDLVACQESMGMVDLGAWESNRLDSSFVHIIIVMIVIVPIGTFLTVQFIQVNGIMSTAVTILSMKSAVKGRKACQDTLVSPANLVYLETLANRDLLVRMEWMELTLLVMRNKL